MSMFKSNLWFYAHKCLFNMGMWATAMVTVYVSDNPLIHVFIWRKRWKSPPPPQNN